MSAYRCKASRLPGTSYAELERNARQLYKIERHRTKRNPYVRSTYFNKEKVFLEYFWHHLAEKRKRDKKRRLLYYGAALELIRHTTLKPVSKRNPNNQSQIVHRFDGLTQTGERFYVQLVENNRGRKHLMSVFPVN